MDFAKSAETQFNLKLPNYDAIHDWSINSTEDFWSHAYNYLGVIGNLGSETGARAGREENTGTTNT